MAGNLTPDELMEIMQNLGNGMEGLGENTNGATISVEDFGNATTQSIKGLTSFTKSVASGSGEMGSVAGVVRDLSSAIGDAIPVVGGLVTGLGQVTAFAIDRLQASFTSFQQLADAGAIGAEGIEGLRDDFDAAGIPLEKYASMLTKNSEDLSFIFGSSLKGSDEFATSMSTMMDSSNNQLRKMGFTVEEVGDTVVNFQKMQNRLGFAQQMSQDQLKNSANKYGEELDMLSKLTGESKKQLQSERDARMLDARYRAHLSTLTKEQAMATESYMALQRKLGPEQEKQAMASITGLVTTSDAIKAEINGTGQIHRDFAKSVQDGDLSVQNMVKYTKLSGEAQGKFAKQMTGYYLAAGDDSGRLAGYASQLDAQVKAGQMSEKEAIRLIETQKKQILETDKTTEVFVNAQENMLRTAVNLDMLATDASFATEAVDVFTSGMVEATNKLRELIGGEATEKEQYVTTKDALRGEVEGKKADEAQALEAVKEAERAIFDAKRKGATELEIIELERTLKKKEKLKKDATDEVKDADLKIVMLDKLHENEFMKARSRIKVIADKNREILQQEQDIRKVVTTANTLKSKVHIDEDELYKDDKKGKADRIETIETAKQNDVDKLSKELDAKRKELDDLKITHNQKVEAERIKLAKPVDKKKESTKDSAPKEVPLSGPLKQTSQQLPKPADDEKNTPEGKKQNQINADVQAKINDKQLVLSEEQNATSKALLAKLEGIENASTEQIKLLTEQIKIFNEQLREAKKTTQAVK